MNIENKYLYMKKKRILSSGLGGGLDVVNASLLYFSALGEGCDPILGSIRPAPQNRLKKCDAFSDSGSTVNQFTQINYGIGAGVARYCQPRISKTLGADLLFFSRKYNEINDSKRLKQAILAAKNRYYIDSMFFVDGGGDSLTIRSSDAAGSSENANSPFVGGDSVSLQALDGVEKAYLAVISVGLDISQEAFRNNLSELKAVDAYFGRVNMRTGEKEDYKLQHQLEINHINNSQYFRLVEQLVAINNEEDKVKSHTAVATYHALKGNFGVQRTYVPWEPEGGVLVEPDHCWMYFFDASKIHALKKQMNN